MKYGLSAIILLGVLATEATALELIAPAEDQQRREIESKYGLRDRHIAANVRLSKHSQREHENNQLLLDIQAKQEGFDDLIGTLPAKVLKGEDMAAHYKAIEGIVTEQDKLQKRYDTGVQSLAEEYRSITEEFEALARSQSQRSEQLVSLKKSIIARLHKDIASNSSSRDIEESGEQECSRFRSINECVKEIENQLVAHARANDPFLNKRSALLSFDLLDATMNLRGQTRYQVRMSFKPSYSNKIESMLNETLGLKVVTVTLNSNVAVDWYIDGIKAGHGDSLVQELPLGKHGIAAVYGDRKKSSIEQLDANTKLAYNFKVAASAENKAQAKGNGKDKGADKEAEGKAAKATTGKAVKVATPDNNTEEGPVDVLIASGNQQESPHNGNSPDADDASLVADTGSSQGNTRKNKYILRADKTTGESAGKAVKAERGYDYYIGLAPQNEDQKKASF